MDKRWKDISLKNDYWTYENKYGTIFGYITRKKDGSWYCVAIKQDKEGDARNRELAFKKVEEWVNGEKHGYTEHEIRS